MKRTLVICGDAWHPAEIIRRGITSLQVEDFDFEFYEDGTKSLAGILPHFQNVVLAKANMISASDQSRWLAPETVKIFRDHLRRGNGLLAVHAGTSRYELSPGMRESIGGVFLRHPPDCDVTVEPQPGHPLVTGVANFTVRDEHYFMDMDDNQIVDVFLHTRSTHGLQPAGWTRREGEGRVCVLTPGHHLEVWQHPSYRKLLLNALRWTAKVN